MSLSLSDEKRLNVSKYVLDASAILAYLNDEPGGERLEEIIGESCVSAVNLGEVVTRLSDDEVPEAEARTLVSLLKLEVVSFDTHSAWIAARLRPLTRSLGLSFGDRACLALGLHLALPVVTADRIWKNIEVGVSIELIR